jgi:hypothetical protein
MTTFIQQKSNHDCVLASIAMAVGKERWEDAWTEEDLQKVIESNGISDISSWVERFGLEEYKHYRHIYVNGDTNRHVKAMLWKRRALLSVESLNTDGGSHMVYWDGTRVFDPQEGVEGKIAFRHLSSMFLNHVHIFAD